MMQGLFHRKIDYCFTNERFTGSYCEYVNGFYERIPLSGKIPRKVNTDGMQTTLKNEGS